jgi:L-malate glycosyltransferase
LISYKAAVWKRNAELVVMFPFVMAGRLAGWLFPLKTSHRIFLFFPSADIGGSIKVNADITECIKNKKPLIIFSKRPKNNEFRDLFNIEGVRVIDLHKWVDYKLYHFINFFFRGMLASWINKAENPVVFGGESMFFYKVIPHVKRSAKVVELCHLNTWIRYTLAFVKYMDLRIFSTPKIKRDVEELYTNEKVPEKFRLQLRFIDNKTDIPSYQENTNELLQVIYVGRGAPQKRVHLIAEIARRMKAANDPVHFSFIGDVDNIIPGEVKAFTTVIGNVSDMYKLHQIYQASDVLILTSAYEGLPIAIMEMMARGRVILSTAVDGIPDYITHLDNGMLIRSTSEEEIIKEGIEHLRYLIKDKTLLHKIRRNSYDYARKHFSGETFCKSYNEILG